MDNYFSDTITSLHIQYLTPRWQLVANPYPFCGFEHYEQAHFPAAFNRGLAAVDNWSGANVGAGGSASGIRQAYGPQADYGMGSMDSLYLPTPTHMGFTPVTWAQMRNSLRAIASKWNTDTSRMAIPGVYASVNPTNQYGIAT